MVPDFHSQPLYQRRQYCEESFPHASLSQSNNNTAQAFFFLTRKTERRGGRNWKDTTRPPNHIPTHPHTNQPTHPPTRQQRLFLGVNRKVLSNLSSSRTYVAEKRYVLQHTYLHDHARQCSRKRSFRECIPILATGGSHYPQLLKEEKEPTLIALRRPCIPSFSFFFSSSSIQRMGKIKL